MFEFTFVSTIFKFRFKITLEFTSVFTFKFTFISSTYKFTVVFTTFKYTSELTCLHSSLHSCLLSVGSHLCLLQSNLLLSIHLNLLPCLHYVNIFLLHLICATAGFISLFDTAFRLIVFPFHKERGALKMKEEMKQQ